MSNTTDFSKIFSQLNDILANTDLNDVSAESSGFSELPEGYYLVEVEKAELTESKSSHQPMVAFQLKVVEDGIDAEVDDNNDIKLTEIKNTKNRKIFKYYVLKDEASVRRFVADMLKFEGEEAGKPILEKECFTNGELIADALDILIGMRLYNQVTVSENDDGTKSTWNSFVSWKRATALELPQ